MIFLIDIILCQIVKHVRGILMDAFVILLYYGFCVYQVLTGFVHGKADIANVIYSKLSKPSITGKKIYGDAEGIFFTKIIP